MAERRPMNVAAFWAKVKKTEGCWLWTAKPRNDGYGRFGRRGSAHRIAFELAYGPIPEGLGLIVCHLCDVPLCVNPVHLVLGTVQDNHADMHRKGRGHRPAGSLHPAAKLTEDQVREIRARKARGERSDMIGLLFGINGLHVNSIVARRAWAHVED